jgi:hypothetical protein
MLFQVAPMFVESRVEHAVLDAEKPQESSFYFRFGTAPALALRGRADF